MIFANPVMYMETFTDFVKQHCVCVCNMCRMWWWVGSKLADSNVQNMQLQREH